MFVEGRVIIFFFFFVEGGIDGWFLVVFQEGVFCTQVVKGVLSVEIVFEEEGVFVFIDVNSIVVIVYIYKNDEGEILVFDFYF